MSVQRASRPDESLTFVESASTGTASVDIAIPVFNEEHSLPGGVRALHDHLSRSFPFPWRVTIVDNASTDGTLAMAEALAEELPGVHVIRTEEKGKGRAVRGAWAASPADIVAYMDVDLSTGLNALLPLIAPLASGHSDVSIGSRLGSGSRTIRGPRREAVSQVYNLLLRTVFRVPFRDATCGFKAMRADVARALLPVVEDEGWFFDSELLLLAQHNNLRIHEVAVDWFEDVDSRVRIRATAMDDLKGVVRIARAKATNRLPVTVPRRPGAKPVHPNVAVADERTRLLWQLGSFGSIGVVSTFLHAGLFWLFRTWWPALIANLVALFLTSVLNAEANRRLTFGVHDHVARRHMRALTLFVLYFVLTMGSLGLLRLLVDDPAPALEAGVVLTASLTATVLRFLLMRSWIFRVPDR